MSLRLFIEYAGQRINEFNKLGEGPPKTVASVDPLKTFTDKLKEHLQAEQDSGIENWR